MLVNPDTPVVAATFALPVTKDIRGARFVLATVEALSTRTIATINAFAR